MSVLMLIERWPRGLRVALGWGATLLVCLLFIPAFIAVGAYFLGLLTCDQSNGTVSGMCSPPVRLLGTAALAGGALICFMPLLRSIQRNLISNSSQPGSRTGSPLPRTALSSAMLPEAVSLSLGQELVTGYVESHSPSGRTMLFSGDTLTLLSVYPFRKGWLKQGDQSVVVYQTLPFGNRSKYLMAFWNGSSNPVRGVAAITHILGIAVALVSALMFWRLAGSETAFALVVCGLGATVSFAYLVLMLRAKVMLRKFLAKGISSAGG